MPRTCKSQRQQDGFFGEGKGSANKTDTYLLGKLQEGSRGHCVCLAKLPRAQRSGHKQCGGWNEGKKELLEKEGKVKAAATRRRHGRPEGIVRIEAARKASVTRHGEDDSLEVVTGLLDGGYEATKETGIAAGSTRFRLGAPSVQIGNVLFAPRSPATALGAAEQPTTSD